MTRRKNEDKTVNRKCGDSLVTRRTYLFNSNSRIENSRRLILSILYLQEIMPVDELITDYEVLKQSLIALSPQYQKIFAPRREIRSELREIRSESRTKQNLLERDAIKVLFVVGNGQIIEMDALSKTKKIIPLLTLIRITDHGKMMIVDDFWLEIEFSEIFRKLIYEYLTLIQRKTFYLRERVETIQQVHELLQEKMGSLPR